MGGGNIGCGPWSVRTGCVVLQLINMVRHNATIKRDDYRFSLVKFVRLMPVLAEFPLLVEQIFFAYNLNNHG